MRTQRQAFWAGRIFGECSQTSPLDSEGTETPGKAGWWVCDSDIPGPGLSAQLPSFCPHSLPLPSLHRPEPCSVLSNGTPAGMALYGILSTGQALWRPCPEVHEPECPRTSLEVNAEAGISFSTSLTPHTCNLAEAPPSVGSTLRSLCPNSLNSSLCAPAAHCVGLDCLLFGLTASLFTHLFLSPTIRRWALWEKRHFLVHHCIPG